MQGYWTAIVTHFAQERRAAHHIERQGFEFYLPETMNGKRRERLFPNYLFVKIRQHWRVLVSTRGVKRMILHDDRPVPMPLKDLERLRAREVNGLIELPAPFMAGDRIQFTDGVLEGCLGLVQDMPSRDRVNVLLELLGRKVALEVDSDSISIAA